MSVSWKTALAEFAVYLKMERGFSANTLDAYKTDVGKLETYCALDERTIPPAEVTADTLRDFLRDLSGMGVSARTQARVLSGLKTFYKFMVLREWLEDSPARRLPAPKASKRLPETLSVHEVELVLSQPDASKPKGLRDRAMLETLYSTGVRVSELTGMKVSDLRLDAGFVKVIGKGDKERLVPIGRQADRWIRRYMAEARPTKIQGQAVDTLFLNRLGQPISRVMVYMIVKECVQAAGIDKNVSPHTFRHSFATHLVEGGANLRAVQQMLGHESILTTEIYTHLDMSYLHQTVKDYHPRNRMDSADS